MLAIMGEPSFGGNGDALGTSQESKRMLPDSQVEQPAGSINLRDLAASAAPAGQDPGVCKAEGRIAELLGENRSLHALISSDTSIHICIYTHTFVHIMEHLPQQTCRIYGLLAGLRPLCLILE